MQRQRLAPIKIDADKLVKHAADQYWRLPAVEAFETGEHKGDTYTEADLDAMVQNFAKFGPHRDMGESHIYEPPAILGHEEEEQAILNATGLPAAGWVDKVWREGSKLYVDIARIPQQVRDWLVAGLYRFCSIGIYLTPPPGIPAEGMMVAHIALLGKSPPNVKTLKPLPAPIPDQAAFAVFCDSSQVVAVRRPLAKSLVLFAEVNMTREQIVQALLAAGVAQATLDKLDDAELQALYAAMQPAAAASTTQADDATVAEFNRAEAITALSEFYPLEELEGKTDDELKALLEEMKSKSMMAADDEGKKAACQTQTHAQAKAKVQTFSGLEVQKIVRHEINRQLAPLQLQLASARATISTASKLAEQRLNEEKTQKIQAFCDELVRDGKVLPAQVPAIKLTLMKLDAVKVATFSDQDGKKHTGTSLDEAMVMYRGWPKLRVYADLPVSNTPAIDQEQRKRNLSMTATGRKALERASKN